MKKNKSIIILLFAALIAINACTHEPENTIPICMTEKINTFKSDATAKAVLSIEVKGETFYWFNTDATYYDGIEYIYGNDCNQACFFCGECASPECIQDFPYEKDQWEIVWKP
jgi:hypothetical protein